jgi:hypothetical protein
MFGRCVLATQRPRRFIIFPEFARLVVDIHDTVNSESAVAGFHLDVHYAALFPPAAPLTALLKLAFLALPRYSYFSLRQRPFFQRLVLLTHPLTCMELATSAPIL